MTEITEKSLESEKKKVEYVRYHDIKTSKGTFLIAVKEISALDLLLFEEKKIEPSTIGATARSVGFLEACKWFIPHTFDILDETTTEEIAVRELSETIMDAIAFESTHLINLIQLVTRVTGQVEIHDDAEVVEESDDFSFEGVRITRLPMSWRHTPYFIKTQRSLDVTKINTEIMTNYFLLDGKKVEMSQLSVPGGIDLRIVVLMLQRVGKLFAQA